MYPHCFSERLKQQSAPVDTHCCSAPPCVGTQCCVQKAGTTEGSGWQEWGRLQGHVSTSDTGLGLGLRWGWSPSLCKHACAHPFACTPAHTVRDTNTLRTYLLRSLPTFINNPVPPAPSISLIALQGGLIKLLVWYS